MPKIFMVCTFNQVKFVVMVSFISAPEERCRSVDLSVSRERIIPRLMTVPQL
jgi:hypothetical protein